MLLLAKDCEDAWSFGLLTSPAVFSSSSHILHAVMPMLCGTDFPSQGSFVAGLFALQCFRNTQLSLSQKAIPSEKEKEGRKERGKLAKQQQRRQAKPQHAPQGAAGTAVHAAERTNYSTSSEIPNTLKQLHAHKLQHACWPHQQNTVCLLSPYYSMQPKLALHLWPVIHITVQLLFYRCKYTSCHFINSTAMSHPSSCPPLPWKTRIWISLAFSSECSSTGQEKKEKSWHAHSSKGVAAVAVF